MQYTDKQQSIIKQTEGPVLAIACPGSGKTTTIIGRVIYMVEEMGIPETQILVTTFTKATAVAMREKFKAMTGRDTLARFSTLHSLCYSILTRQNIYHIKHEGDKDRDEFGNKIIYYERISEYDVKSFFRNRIDGNRNYKDLKRRIDAIITAISRVRNSDVDYRVAARFEEHPQEFIDHYEAYERYKKEHHFFDFDDLLITCRRVLIENPNIRAWCQNLYSHIIVDEFQDTNTIQADLLQILAEKHQNICVVGDDDQAIYRFRAADSSIMLSFKDRYPNCKQFALDTNYRSKQSIIDVASKLIQNNNVRFQKEFLKSKKEKGSVSSQTYEDSTKEGIWVEEQIQKLTKEGVKLNEIAVLYRNNNLMDPIASRLALKGVPFRTSKGDKLKCMYEDVVFEDIKRYYRLAIGKEGNHDYSSIINHPGRFLKKALFENIKNHKEEDKIERAILQSSRPNSARTSILKLRNMIESFQDITPREVFALLDKFKYSDWLVNQYADFAQKDPDVLEQNYEDLREDAFFFDTMEAWFKHGAEVVKKMEESQENEDGITLSTFHSSKGLEWEHVFILDAEEGIIPSKHAICEEEVEEERRLFYVAITRAKNNLVICEPENANKSSFLLEIEDLIRELNKGPITNIKEAKEKAQTKEAEKIKSIKKIKEVEEIKEPWPKRVEKICPTLEHCEIEDIWKNSFA